MPARRQPCLASRTFAVCPDSATSRDASLPCDSPAAWPDGHSSFGGTRCMSRKDRDSALSMGDAVRHHRIVDSDCASCWDGFRIRSSSCLTLFRALMGAKGSSDCHNALRVRRSSSCGVLPYIRDICGVLSERPTSERVGPRTSRSAGLSRRYRWTASARFPGRGRAHYEGSAGDEESIPCVQYYGDTSLYHHLDLVGDDVADLFSWMNVPSGLDSRRNQRLHLHQSRDLESITASAGPPAEKACPPGRPVT
jgi:hypothetical protein